MKNRLLPVAIVIIVAIALGYFIYSSPERLPMVKTEEITVIEVYSTTGQVLQNITDKQVIAPVIRYYSQAKILNSSDNNPSIARLELKIYDGRVVSIRPLGTDTVTIGIKDKSGYKQYEVLSPDLVKYLENIIK